MRTQLTNGDDCNGLEPWRKLFIEHRGGAEHVRMAGIARLHMFPKCPHRPKRRVALGEWLTLKKKFGGRLPDE